MPPKSQDLTSGSFASPPANAKHLLIARDGLAAPWGSCTICKDEGVAYDIAHVLPQHDREKFASYKNAGLLPPEVISLGHLDVVIYICSNCHRLWDMNDPRLTIIPNDIEFFIQWEEADYRRREAEVAAGNFPPQRTVPNGDDYKGGYSWYYLADRQVPGTLRLAMQTYGRSVTTKAAPTALILKSWKSMGTPVQYPENVLPRNTRAQTSLLLNLWERPPPIPRPPPATSTETLPDPPCLKKGRSPPDDDEPGWGQSSPKYRKENRSEAKRQRTGQQTTTQQTKVVDDNQEVEEPWDAEEDFMFGPLMTSAKLMERLR
ncbi:hypothetical protein DRE_02764 [Drechslerella stenobrocha 248]|uniref:HNH nuclease domain-containing protein n=1 Tax=Drechslerella stenobrocha 248 TaxID=1043628 RepID=W7I5X8_9PEZI|nr:hypothetical protein DRE_02764 [Drechslerella stenobrocha 248]